MEPSRIRPRSGLEPDNRASQAPAARRPEHRMAGALNGHASGAPELVVLRGENRADLLVKIRRLIEFLNHQPGVKLADLAFTLNSGLADGGCRVAFVAGSMAELLERLARAEARVSDPDCRHIRDGLGIYFAQEPLYGAGRVAMLFPGEGAQYLGMMADLVDAFPTVRECFELCDIQATATGLTNPQAVSRFMRRPTELSAAEQQEMQRDLLSLDNAMYAVLAGDWAMNRLLVEELGIKAHAVAGHSAGELAALWSAGGLDSIADLEQLGATMQMLERNGPEGTSGDSVLLAVGASRKAMRELVEKLVTESNGSFHASDVFVAMDNCPHQSVVVGTPGAMQAVESALAGRKIFHERLPFGRPYHTPLFAPYMGPLVKMFETVKFSRPHTKVYSCTTGLPFPNDSAEISRLALAHWASPVEFTQMIRNMHADGMRIFIECGPRGNLTAFVEDILRGETFLAVASDVSRRPGLTQLCHVVAQLAAHHVPLRLDRLYMNREVEPIDLGVRVHQQPAAPPVMDSPVHVAAPGSHSMTPPQPTGPRAALVQSYWSVMDQFVDDQQHVMETFLRRRRGAAPTAAPIPRTAMAQPAAVPRPITLPQTPVVPTPIHEVPKSAVGGPLVGEIVEFEAGKRLVMRRRLEPSEDLYADDHTVGGRDISSVDPNQHGLPITPMTFSLEIMAEAASLLGDGRVVTAICDVRLAKWLVVDDPAITIEVIAEVVSDTKSSANDGRIEVAVEIRDLGTDASQGKTPVTTANGKVTLRPTYVAPPKRPMTLNDSRPCRVTTRELYRNLFHGDRFKGVESLVAINDAEIEARLRVLPRHDLFASNPDPKFLIDPVTIDVMMHPSAAWHLEQPDQAGRMLLPFEMKRIEFYGTPPDVGTQLRTVSRVIQSSPRHFAHEGDCFRMDGTQWCHLTGVKCWRFYMPFGEVNFNGPKDEYFLSKDWSSALPTDGTSLQATINPAEPAEKLKSATAAAVRLDPGADLSQSAMQEAAARVTLSPRELAEFRSLDEGPAHQTAWLFSRVAAKDAARILWRAIDGHRLFIADIELMHDQYGRPVVSPRGAKRPANFPTVAIAQTEGLIAAMATTTRYAGLAVERVIPNRRIDEELIDTGEAACLAAWGEEQDEAQARFIAAKRAICDALGPRLIDPAAHLAVRTANPDTGWLTVALGPELATIFPEFQSAQLLVRTTRDGEFVVAATRCEEVTP